LAVEPLPEIFDPDLSRSIEPGIHGFAIPLEGLCRVRFACLWFQPLEIAGIEGAAHRKGGFAMAGLGRALVELARLQDVAIAHEPVALADEILNFGLGHALGACLRRGESRNLCPSLPLRRLRSGGGSRC